MIQERAYFIHLLASALNSIKPGEKPETVSFNDIYTEAARQNLLSVIFCSVNRLNIKPDKELYNKWQAAFLRESLKSDRMSVEATELSNTLAERGIPVMLLKGCVIQPLYVESVYRSMSDIDLMYFTDDVTFENAMEALGYTLKSRGECHDIYLKSHYTRIESHKKLFAHDSAYGILFDNVQKKALSDSDSQNLLHMTNEDAYLHLLCHAAKHYMNSGIGLRVLSDIYVTLKAYRDSFDYEYLNEKLSSVGLLRFKNVLEQLAYAWLGDGEISIPQIVEDDFFLGSVYGNSETIALRRISMSDQGTFRAKLTYILKIVFLPKQLLENTYPVLKKHPWLLPFLEIHRWLKKLFCNTKRVKAVIHSVSSADKINIEHQNERFSFFGFTEDELSQ